MDSPNYKFTVQGLGETIDAITLFAPDLKKNLNKEIKGIISRIVTEARGHIPDSIHPSGWARENKNSGLIGPLQQNESRGTFVPFDFSKAKSGINSVVPRSKSTSRGFSNSYGVIQRDKAGAIFETAGRASNRSRMRSKTSKSTNPRASEQFIGVLNATYGELPKAQYKGNDKGRAVIKAVGDNKKNIQREIFDALRNAEKKAQTRMDEVLKQGEV